MVPKSLYQRKKLFFIVEKDRGHRIRQLNSSCDNLHADKIHNATYTVLVIGYLSD
jgi:hypothetical protein